MTNTTELRKKLFEILHDELEASCVGNGVTECTWTVMGTAKVVDRMLAEIEQAERRRTEEVIETLEVEVWDGNELPLADVAHNLRSKFLTPPSDG